MRNWMSLVPKDAQGNEIVAKNFEISFDTTIRQRYGHGGLMVQFRSQPTAAKVPETVSYSDSTTVSGKVANGQDSAYTERAAVLLGANGVGVLSGNKVHNGSENAGLLKHCLYSDKAAELENVLYEFYSSKISNTNSMTRSLKVNIKVVNSTVTVKVAEAGGAELYNKDITIDYDKEGVIAISGLSSDLDISNITLKTLNSRGEQVAVNTPVFATFVDKVDHTDAVTEGVYDFSADSEVNNAIRDAINVKYNVYGNLDSTMHQFAGAEVGGTNETLTNATNAAVIQLKATPNGYNLGTSSASYDGRTMRTALSLVPKNAKGEEIVAKNAEVSFDLSTSMRYSNGGIMLMFRAQDSGYAAFNSNDSKQPYANRVGLLITANGAAILDGAEVSTTNASLWGKPAADSSIITAFASGATTNGTTSGLHVTAKVLDNQFTATITKDGAVIYEATKEVTWMKAGTISFTGFYGDHAISNITLNVLNEEGIVVEPVVQKFDEGSVAIDVESLKGSEDGTKTYATVTPDEGVQLKAGTLRARKAGTDGPFNILPTRVGWRSTNYQADTFVFDVDFDIEVTAEFYTPHTTAAANVAVLGTSKTSSGDEGNLYGNAVRFISRSYIYEKDGAFYMDINGRAREVADFGAFVTSQMALTAGGYEDIRKAIDEETNTAKIKNVVKRSIPEAGQAKGKSGIFYDYCEDYVDVSIQITGIPAAAVSQQIVSCTYIQFATGDVVYTTGVSVSHENA
jgi:hypothetical protein